MEYGPITTIGKRGHAAAAACLVAVAALGALPSTAAAQSAHIVARATVLRHVSLRLSSPQVLTLTEADIRRGYVDVPTPMRVTVQSNVSEGYVLVLQRHGAQVREAVVQGPAGRLTVDEAGTTLRRAARGTSTWRDEMDLGVRFILASGATPGDHAWPLQVSMMSQ